MRMTRLFCGLTSTAVGALLLSVPAFGQVNVRVSVDSSGVEGNSHSGSTIQETRGLALSADGRFVAFQSVASNLVGGDTNLTGDVFVHDRLSGTTERVSVDSAGAQGSSASRLSRISADGRFVAFQSDASNLVVGDTNGSSDLFVHDRQSRRTERVSVDSGGAQGNNHSFYASISADGRFVVFQSFASNLVVGDTNRTSDVFVHDRLHDTTERVSVDSSGAQANDNSFHVPSISTDGRFVTFVSGATNLVAGDTNGHWDVFVRDRQNATTERVSVDSAGGQASGGCTTPLISADGRFVAFGSFANDLVPNDTNGYQDVFVHDLQTGQTSLVSTDSAGLPGNYDAKIGDLSADGRFVAFDSLASNLVAGDTNHFLDVFVHDRQSGTTERVSLDSAGAEANSLSLGASLSSDGRLVAFESFASNLVAGDTNGANDVFVHGRGCALASATSRNAGSNPASYTCSAPVLGTSWSGTVDLSTTGHSAAYVLVSTTPASATLSGGQVLLGTGWVNALGPVSGPLASFAFALPSDLALCGQRFTTQAVHLGTVRPFALSNAMDLVVGQ